MDPLSTAWYQRQSRLSATAAAAVEALWGQVDPARISESWAELLPQAVQAVTVGQLAAATQADTYVAAQMVRQNAKPDPSGRVNPTAFAGVAADGGELASLLYLPAVEAKVRIAGGYPEKDALLSGGYSLLTAVATETADAGRLATQVGITSDRRARGYRRMLVTPSCSRCVALAGKFFSHNQGFDRHPRCDCVHIPAAAAGDLTDDSVNPYNAFSSMTREQQDKSFGKTNAQAIRDGAEIGQVVNARRGMSKTGTQRQPMTTDEGTTRRGAYARRAINQPGVVTTVIRTKGGLGRNATRVTGRSARKSVEYCYWSANGDRDEVIRLLRKYAYIL